MAAPQPDRPPVDPGERPGTDVLTQAIIYALVPVLSHTFTFAQEKVNEVFQRNRSKESLVME